MVDNGPWTRPEDSLLACEPSALPVQPIDIRAPLTDDGAVLVTARVDLLVRPVLSLVFHGIARGRTGADGRLQDLSNRAC